MIVYEISLAPNTARVAVALSKLAGLSELAANSRDPEILLPALVRMFKKWASGLEDYDKPILGSTEPHSSHCAQHLLARFLQAELQTGPVSSSDGP